MRFCKQMCKFGISSKCCFMNADFQFSSFIWYLGQTIYPVLDWRHSTNVFGLWQQKYVLGTQQHSSILLLQFSALHFEQIAVIIPTINILFVVLEAVIISDTFGTINHPICLIIKNEYPTRRNIIWYNGHIHHWIWLSFPQSYSCK